MKKDKYALNTDEVKRIGLEGLLAFKKVCDEYGLRYYLAYGTLLGAVRHQGFIPWDDDIDVWMPRPDYDQLASLINYDMGEWRVLTAKTETGFFFPWMKISNTKSVIMPSRFNSGLVYGVSIDVFPLDYWEGEERGDVEKELEYYRNKYVTCRKKIMPYATVQEGWINGINRTFKKVYFNIIGKRCKLAIEMLKYGIDEEINRRVISETKFCAYVNDRYKAVFLVDDFVGSEDRYLTFEGEYFRVPYNFDNVLREIYQDYMVLPREEKRVLIHYYKAYGIRS